MSESEKPKDKSLKKRAKNAEMKKREHSPAVAALRSFFTSPIFNVAALVLLLVAVFGGLRLFSGSRNPAQVSFVERSACGRGRNRRLKRPYFARAGNFQRRSLSVGDSSARNRRARNGDLAWSSSPNTRSGEAFRRIWTEFSFRFPSAV